LGPKIKNLPFLSITTYHYHANLSTDLDKTDLGIPTRACPHTVLRHEHQQHQEGK
jgi:hypothetical protein